jgi:hypothetical protein
MIIVTEDAQKRVIGQMIFVPSKVLVDGNEVNAYRIMAPIISNDYRGLDIRNYEHPAHAMFRFGVEEARKNNCEVIYFLPSIKWVATAKAFPKYGLPEASISVYDGVQISCSADHKVAKHSLEDYYIQPGKFDAEYDQLWQEAIKSLPIQRAVSRNSNWLKWKRGPHLLLEVRDRDKDNLVGYIVIKKSSGLVVDLLAGTLLQLELVLQLTVQLLHEGNSYKPEVNLSGIKLMLTPLIQKVIHSIPNDKIDFQFAFVYFFLTEKVKGNTEWYIMPDD